MTKGEPVASGEPGARSDLAGALSRSTAGGKCGNLGDTRGLLEDLIGYGCPLVLCTPRSDYKPGDNADLFHPDGWQTAEPDPAVVDAYTPGVHTPALVNGHVLDAIDVDTKNGADLQAILRSACDDHGVVIVGVHHTPSGGAHLFVASTGICSAAKRVNGVDFRGGSADGSGRGLIYLPGANRPKYAGMDYKVALPIDWDALAGADLDEQRDAIWSFLKSVGIGPRLSAAKKADTVDVEPLPDNLHAELVEKIENLDAAPVGKRSERFFHLVGECYRHGLTQGQSVTALSGWCAAVGKYAGRVEEQVAACWTKVQQSDVNVHVEEIPVASPPTAPVGARPATDSEPTELSARKVVLTNAAGIKPKPTTWTWTGRLPTGSLGLIAGPEGTGKSTCGYWIAARVTCGELPGIHHGSPKDVLIAATEDSWERTIVPRLIAAGADLERVWRVEVITSLGTGGDLTLPKDVPGLADQVTDKSAAMILLDPIMSRLDAGLDTHKDAETRRALEPIAALADRTGVAVLGLIHFNKGGSPEVLNNVMASKAFTAVARSVSTVIRDPNDDSGQVRIFGTPKSNLGRDDLPLLPFQLAEYNFENEDGEKITTSRIEWLTERQGNMGDLMRQARDGDHSIVREVADWLADFLEAQGGRSPRANIIDAGKRERFSEEQIKRGYRRLGLKYRSHGFPRTTYWMTAEEAVKWDEAVAKPSQLILRGESPTALTSLTGDAEAQSG